MKSSGLFLLIMFIFTNKACGKGNILREVRKGKVVEPRYHFNHPPSAEYYNPIPVSVVYEDSNNYSGKSEITIEEKTDESSKDARKGKFAELNHHLNHPPSVDNYDPIPVAIVSEDSYSVKSNTATEDAKSVENFETSKNEKIANEAETDHKQTATDTPNLSIANKTNVKLAIKPLNLNKFQIPVAVVYESDYNNYQNHKKRKTDTNTGSPITRASYSRKIETAVNSKQEPIIQTTEENTENLQPKGDTRVFKKRTEGRDPVVPIVEMESYIFSHSGNFHYSYEGGDGTKAYSEGKQVNIDDEAGESVVGGFSYKGKDGNDYSLTYTADENGYRPVGDHLPTPPPIPPAIARALEYLATATPEPDTNTKRPDKS